MNTDTRRVVCSGGARTGVEQGTQIPVYLKYMCLSVPAFSWHPYVYMYMFIYMHMYMIVHVHVHCFSLLIMHSLMLDLAHLIMPPAKLFL